MPLDADCMLAGGTEASINNITMAGFCKLRALSTKVRHVAVCVFHCLSFCAPVRLRMIVFLFALPRLLAFVHLHVVVIPMSVRVPSPSCLSSSECLFVDLHLSAHLTVCLFVSAH